MDTGLIEDLGRQKLATLFVYMNALKDTEVFVLAMAEDAAVNELERESALAGIRALIAQVQEELDRRRAAMRDVVVCMRTWQTARGR